MKILGIDPGTASMGYGVVDVTSSNRPILKDHGVIITKTEIDMPKRLEVLYAGLNELAKIHLPDIVVVEKILFNTNVKTALSVGQARGISLLVAAHNNIIVFEYTALQAKRLLAGYGRADKKEMQEAVKKHLGISSIIKPDDANDGVAMALCHLKII